MLNAVDRTREGLGALTVLDLQTRLDQLHRAHNEGVEHTRVCASESDLPESELLAFLLEEIPALRVGREHARVDDGDRRHRGAHTLEQGKWSLPAHRLRDYVECGAEARGGLHADLDCVEGVAHDCERDARGRARDQIL